MHEDAQDMQITAFAADQQDEVRDLHDLAGALGAQPGMKQQTFIAEEKRQEPDASPLAAAFSAGQGAKAGGIGYQEECAPTLKASESGTNMVPSVLCLNDQGGKVMACTVDKTGTLRAQEHGHQPLVYENHGIDSRYTGPHKVSPTMSARYGTGGNNVPLVEQESTFCITGNSIDRQPQNGGNGLGCQENIAYTLTATDRHAVYSRQRVDLFQENHVTSTESARQYKDATDLVMDVAGLDCRNGKENGDLCGTLQKGTTGSSLNSIHPLRNGKLIRMEMFRRSTKKKEHVWDFSIHAPEKLKRQIFDILHYELENSTGSENRRVHLMGLHDLYDFCTEQGIEDIETMELPQIEAFREAPSERLNGPKRSRIINFCRRALFMQAEEINWNAHVWYMERFRIQPERIDPANPVMTISFVEVAHRRNRELLKKYIRYGLGVTNLSISVIRGEQIYLRGFLNDIQQTEDEDICSVTPAQMEAYFRAQRQRDVQAETYNKIVMSILHFFHYLQVRQIIERIPFDADSLVKKTIPEHHNRSVVQEVTDEIFSKLYAFPETIRLMYLHLWGIGLRISEVCTLKGDAYYIQGKDTWIQVYQTKMRTYKRIPIPAALYKLMRVYLKKHHIKAGDYVFQNTKGGPYRSGTFRKKMLNLCESNNIQNGEYIFRSHDYRHTIASCFYDSGVSLQSIRDYLGHECEEMTEQYIDYMPRKIEKANEEYFGQHNLAAHIRGGEKKDG